ncbi:MAG: hypothetical protein ABS68_04390 [Niastella sp. SCN 39-18]|nr:ABC transporter substrate-binding protein [Sphingobacteriales bacterium]ODT53868.1 MAG: hypothetical protein ABS68_04390 [Niastella sp. SCN 39-18]OJW07746.1 MAG: hypothetical protein BGO53_03425 [Sphingobacteriales bacterium 39-19]
MLLTSPILPYRPQKIISLVPSQTELLYYLGLEAGVIAITKFCVHPDHWFHTKKRIGGTKQLHVSEIEALQPDLIIANKEENTKEQIEALALKFPVWLTDVNHLPDAYQMILDIGQLTHTGEKAAQLCRDIQLQFQLYKKNTIKPIRAAYFIWKEPCMVAASHTFIHHMMKEAGLANAFNNKERYPQVSIPEIKLSGCQIGLLSSEPYPFKEKHIHEMQSLLPGIKFILTDGEMFSWYGSRLLKAPEYFHQLHQKIREL